MGGVGMVESSAPSEIKGPVSAVWMLNIRSWTTVLSRVGISFMGVWRARVRAREVRLVMAVSWCVGSMEVANSRRKSWAESPVRLTLRWRRSSWAGCKVSGGRELRSS